MGYCSVFSGKVFKDNKQLESSELNEIRDKLNEMYDAFDISDNELVSDGIKFYDYKNAIETLSKNYPDHVFSFKRAGESTEDLEIIIAIKGKLQCWVLDTSDNQFFSSFQKKIKGMKLC